MNFEAVYEPAYGLISPMVLRMENQYTNYKRTVTNFTLQTGYLLLVRKVLFTKG